MDDPSCKFSVQMSPVKESLSVRDPLPVSPSGVTWFSPMRLAGLARPDACHLVANPVVDGFFRIA
jgi:hypothetical protein